jgi:hypothetical protein
MNRSIRFLLITFAIIMILIPLAVNLMGIKEGASASVDANVVPTNKFRPSNIRSQTARTLPSAPRLVDAPQLQRPSTDGIPKTGASTSAAVDDIKTKDICASIPFMDKCLNTRHLFIPSFRNKGKTVPAVEKFCKWNDKTKKCLKDE